MKTGRRPFDTDIYRAHFLGRPGTEHLTPQARSDLAAAFDEIDRLTDERDRLQELLAEGQAVNDELTEALRAAAEDLRIERDRVSALEAGRRV